MQLQWHKSHISTNKMHFMERVGFSFKDFSPPCKELRESEVKNTLELPVKVATVPLKFKKAFP